MRRSLLLAVVLLAGCGSNNGNSNQAADTSGSAGAGSVELTATEFKLDPATVQVDKAGQTTFTVVNHGKFGHALEIEGQGVEEKTGTIDAGKSATLEVDLKPGEYEFYCPIGDHRKKGMEGKLTVAGAAGQTGTTTEETTTESSGYGS